MVEILGQLVKFEIRWNAIQRPGFGVWLKGSKQDLACVFFIIGAFVRHAQDRQLLQPLNGFGDDIEMLAGLKRHIHAQHLPHLAPPHAGAVHDHLAGDMPAVAVLRPIDTGDAAALPGHAHGAGPLEDLPTALPRPLCQGQRDIGRVALPVLVEVYRPRHIPDVEVRIFLLHLRRADLLHIHAKGTGHGRLTVDFLAALAGQGNGDGTAALEPRGNARFCFADCRKAPANILRASSYSPSRAAARSDRQRARWCPRSAACVPEARHRASPAWSGGKRQSSR